MKSATIMKFYVVLHAALLPIGTKAWIWRHWNREHLDYENEFSEEDDDLDAQLAAVRCPARVNLNLTDYWKCLWRTSITVEGIQQHRKILEEYEKHKNLQEGLKEPVKNVSKKAKKRRKKRALSEETLKNMDLVTNITDDILEIFGGYPWVVTGCQEAVILPGISLYSFFMCFIRNGYSANITWPEYISKATPIKPPIDTSYDSREFKTLSSDETNLNMDLLFKFDRMPEEEAKNAEFGGADPYVEEQYTSLRYRYNNLQANQRQPGWSFTGNNAPVSWQYLELKKFFFPTKSGEDWKRAWKIADLAQVYPGLGEITQEVDISLRPELVDPVDHKWEPNDGYYIYTRFLLPLLTKKDMDYFELKGVNMKGESLTTDFVLLLNTRIQLDKFLNFSSKPLGVYVESDDWNWHATVENNSEIVYFDVYKQFFEHYFQYDFQQYLGDKRERYPPGDSRRELVARQFDVARLVLRAYVYAVRVQIFCTMQMVKKYEYRRQGKDRDDVVNEALKTCENQGTPPEVGLPSYLFAATLPRYNMTKDLLTTLYKMYFDRKESRQRYSLPMFPYEYPVCKHNEPSPIDIVLKNVVKSSLRTYIFGDAAYRLQQFTMKFPMDGSNLLSVGIHGGERLDDSSVRLTGGAVKGQNLTFQQMNIRFSHSWKVDGSEHRFDGIGTPMELQMIFTIAGSDDYLKYYHILARVQNELFQFREKLVIILAVLVDVQETEADVKERIKKDESNQDPYLFEPFAQAAFNFRKQEERRPDFNSRGYLSIDPVFRLIDFIPQKSRFYTYRGSLSWPPCFPYVLWSVFKQRLYMSKRQFDEFTKIPANGISDNNFASDNIRQLKDIRVEEENEPELEYSERQRKVHARTVERLVLEGFHDPAGNTHQGVVDDDIYYLLNDDTSVAPLKYCHKNFLAAAVFVLLILNF